MHLDSQGGPGYIDPRWYIIAPPGGTLLLRRLHIIDGQPSIAYIVRTYKPSGVDYETELKYARYNGVTWDLTTIDSAHSPDTVSYPSLSLVDGQPAIGYLKRNDHSDYRDLMYTRYNGSVWVTESVGETARSHVSLAELDGKPAIAYKAEPGKIDYVEFDGMSWNNANVASQASSPKLIVSEGRPAIGYQTLNDSFLMYASYIPEPATLALLLLGSLALLQRP